MMFCCGTMTKVVYTVKSGYWLGCSMREEACSSERKELVGWWTFLWKAPIPSKVKIFIWKACHDWLPTFHNLSRRGIKVRNCCPLCRSDIETIWHALWGCRLLKDIRVFLPLLQGVKGGNLGQFLDFMLYCFEHLSNADMVLICVVMWRLWSLRNSKIHGASIREGMDPVTWARN
ncbi:hypothetical protein Dsin_017491 [Dipteronia sinensis]|uniref:Reverse transcriptase zinc-binding domain-containing protein n=1 Tax=Dipteronia sinensis TaxID=43782 RepID=A0AAE0AGI0_9ROSI|nr:hypothetical protein Dsin_017491 [Dipteronia sinensis]